MKATGHKKEKFFCHSELEKLGQLGHMQKAKCF